MAEGIEGREVISEGSVALLSVYDKTGIEEFAAELVELGIPVYSSGGTADCIRAAGVEVTDVAELVGGQAILGHKVVTLSREVHAGLLADLDNEAELAEVEGLHIPIISLVGVDMYPLEEEIANPESTSESVRAKTDIGGPTMLRAGAKGRRIVLSVPEQREQVLDWLKAGMPDADAFVDGLAARAEYEAARYIGISAQYLGGEDVVLRAGRRVLTAQYGENAWMQPAGLHADNRVNVDPLGLDQFELRKGSPSYNNLVDIDRLLQTATHIAAGFERNFVDVPAIAVGVKHGNACGAAVGDTLADATRKMLEGDELAIYGGVVMLAGEIDEEVATILMRHHVEDDAPNRMLDAIVAAGITPEAEAILSKRAKVRILLNPALGGLGEGSLDRAPRTRYVRGGVLVQPNYTFVQDLSAEHMQHHGEMTERQRRELVLAWAIGSTSNSNTITLVKDEMLIGNGVGQQDRVGAARLALSRAADRGHDTVGASAYSDSFFPFADGPQVLVDGGIGAILTSSGSVRDGEVIETFLAGGVGVSMVPDAVGRGFFGH